MKGRKYYLRIRRRVLRAAAKKSSTRIAPGGLPLRMPRHRAEHPIDTGARR